MKIRTLEEVLEKIGVQIDKLNELTPREIIEVLDRLILERMKGYDDNITNYFNKAWSNKDNE